MFRRGFCALNGFRISFICNRNVSQKASFSKFTSLYKKCPIPFYHTQCHYKPLLGLSVLGWLGLEKQPENIEDELILKIKWGILLLQRKDYKKSEKMFHVALRMAQQLQNQKAVTYIYDMMANLALETGEYDKSEKLFVSVMQRLIGSGLAENDIKNVHISLKIARCNHLNGNLEKAGIGYKWVLGHLEENDKDGEVTPTSKLLAIAKDWYGHCLYQQKETKAAMKHLTEAYDLLKKIDDEEDLDEIICLINDIGTIYYDIGDLENAEKYLKEAIRMNLKHTEDLETLSTLYTNLGRLYLTMGDTKKAHKGCNKALKLAIASKSEECALEAKECLKTILNNRK